MFEKKTTESLLSLLAMTVLADKRLFASEIDCFVTSAIRLEEVEAFEEKLTEPKLLMWFELNRDELKVKMRTPGFESWFESCIESLIAVKSKPNILMAMSQISHADNDLHFGEIALIQLTAAFWDVAMPSLDCKTFAQA